MKKNQFVNSSLSNEAIEQDWQQYNARFAIQTQYFNSMYAFQASSINGKKQASDVNLYKLFLEKSYDVLNVDGLCGIVMPAGIYSDLGTRELRRLLFQHTRINHLYSFINKKGIFKSIHRQFKFCILVFVKGGSTKKFLAGFYLDGNLKLQSMNDKAFEFDLEMLKTISPNSLSLIECKNKTAAQILQKICSHPALGGNVWGIKARSEFHMTNDAVLFNTEGGVPLYEGKMIYQFSHALAEPKYWINAKVGIAHLSNKEKKRLKKNKHSIEPRLDSECYRLVWRDVTNAVDRRTMISTILPPRVFLGNTLSYIRPITYNEKGYSYSMHLDELAYLCGMLNSFPVDFILRHRVNLHVSIFHFMELSIPKFNRNNILHKTISQNAARLICTSKDFATIMERNNIKNGIVDPKERRRLQALINATSCQIYGINTNELQFILEYFEIENDELKKQALDILRDHSPL